VFSCLDFLSCVPVLFNFVCYYVSQEIGWEDYPRDTIRVEGFPLQRARLKSCFVLVSFCIFAVCDIYNFSDKFTFLTAKYF